ncbi:8248_t:CDS:2, partial [Paraglomus brasilianum]
VSVVSKSITDLFSGVDALFTLRGRPSLLVFSLTTSSATSSKDGR